MRIQKQVFVWLLPAYLLVLFLISYTAYASFFPSETGDANNANIKENQNTKKDTPELISGNPILLTLPRLEIEVGVIDGNYEKTVKKWNVSETFAHFATITALPNNQSGNTLIYGHNSLRIFGKTQDLLPGDRLFLKTNNDYIFIYEFESAEEVSPQSTQIFIYQGAPRLTLLTCSGLFNEKRRVMTFAFRTVIKNK